jgi:hypothetical protein
VGEHDDGWVGVGNISGHLVQALQGIQQTIGQTRENLRISFFLFPSHSNRSLVELKVGGGKGKVSKMEPGLGMVDAKEK